MNWITETIKYYEDKPDEADVFGIILYTESNPHIVKLLRDNDYWNALDVMSGNRWSVFAIRTQRGSMDLPQPSKGSFAYLMPIWREPKENEKLLEFFDLNSTEELPLLMVFSIDENGRVLKNEFKLDDDTIEIAYNSLRCALKTVSCALCHISDENLKNKYGVYNALCLSINDYKDWKRIRNGFKIWQWFKSVGV